MSDNLGPLTVATSRAEHAEMRLAGAIKVNDDLANQLVAEQKKSELAIGKVEGLESDLYNAVQTAYHRGAVDWVKWNYPRYYAQLKHTPPVYADSPASLNVMLDMAISLLREGPQTEKIQAFLASVVPSGIAKIIEAEKNSDWSEPVSGGQMMDIIKSWNDENND